jgi:hypothetical protein
LGDTITAYLGKLAGMAARGAPAPARRPPRRDERGVGSRAAADGCRYCDGLVHAGHARAVGKIITEADQLRHACVALSAADGESCSPVIAACHLPKGTGSAAEVIAAAARLLQLAQMLQPIVSRSIGLAWPPRLGPYGLPSRHPASMWRPTSQAPPTPPPATGWTR